MSAEQHTSRHRDAESSEHQPLVGRLLSCVWQTTQAIRLYDLDHPLVWDKAEESVTAQRACAGGGWPLTVTLTPDGFTLDGRSVGRDAALDEFAQQMHGHNVAALEFVGELTTQQVVALAQCLGCSASQLSDPSFELCIAESTDGRVRSVSLDCDRLGRRDGVRHGDDDAGPNWEHMVQKAIGAPDGQPASAGDLAEQVNGEGADPIEMSELRQALERSAGAAGSGQSQRVRQFVGGLNPEMRHKLFRAASGNGDAAMALVSEVADVLETDEIVTAMNSVQFKGLQLSPETLRMCRKLSQCLKPTEQSGEDVTELREQLSQIEQQIGQLGDGSLEDLTEVFERRSTEQYTPDDYSDQLNKLSGLNDDESASGASHDMGYSEQADTHAAEVAVMTLETNDPAEQGECDGALRYLADRLQSLIAQGRLLTVLETKQQAERWAECRVCEPTRGAAEELLKAFEWGAVVELLLDRAAESGTMAEQATRLLSSTNATVAAAVLARLNGVNNPQACGRLHGILDTIEPPVLQAAVGELVTAGDDQSVQAVFCYARLAEQGRVAPLMQMLMNHAQHEVRLTAASVLVDRNCVQASTIGRWLSDSNEEVSRYAARCLVERNDDASVEQLGELFEGRLGERDAGAGLVASIVEMAAERSPRVLSRACRALLRLTESMRPTNARLARRLAVALAVHGKTEEVRQSLAGWRFSGTRLIGFLHEGGARCIRVFKR